MSRPERWRYDRIVGDGARAEDAGIEDGPSSFAASRPIADDLYDDDSFNSEEEVDNDSILNDDDAYNDPNAPTQSELQTLRRIPDRLPLSVFLVAIVELCERFGYYGMVGPLQNYISNRYQDDANPGALGMGQSAATAMTSAFTAWCYITPLIGAVVADQYLGKYRTILAFSVFYIAGLFVLFISSLPAAIEGNVALMGLIIAMLVIGVGTGGIKSNVSPLIAEQLTETKIRTRILESGDKVLVDPELTVQRVYMIFYMCINIGALSGMLTTSLELHVGFWAAYGLSLIVFIAGVVVLILGKKQYVDAPPKGSVVVDSFRVIWMAMRSGQGLAIAKPSVRRSMKLDTKMINWSDSFVDELSTALGACKVFMFYPFYWVVFSQMQNNFVSQAGTMELHGIPNDIMGNLDPIVIALMIPILDRIIYPFLRQRGIQFKPITRIALGFVIGAVAMIYAAWLQSRVYAAPPCFDEPLKCSAAQQPDGKILHNEVHIAWQTPAFVFIALSEILCSVTGLEYAYTKAPKSMKSFIMSIFLLTSAGGSALGVAIAPFARDPNMVWFYLGLGATAVAFGLGFWIKFRRLNHVTQKETVRADVLADESEAIGAAGMPAIPLTSQRKKEARKKPDWK